LILTTLVSPSLAFAGDETTFAELRAKHIRNLTESDTAVEARRAAAQWLGEIRNSEDAAIIAALERALKDADARVRAAAVVARAKLAMCGKGPCPSGVIAAMLDGDAAVREQALNYCGAYPPGRLSQDAAPVLLRCLESTDYSVRSLAVLLLANLPKKDAAITQAVRDRTSDKHLLVRNDAHSALFKITGKLDDFVPYALRFRVDQHDAARIRTERPSAQEQAMKNLITIGLAFRLRSLAEKRTDDLARYLIDRLADEDATLRRATALFFAAYYRDDDGLLPLITPRAMTPLWPYVDPKPPPGVKKPAKEGEPQGGPSFLPFGDSEAQRKQFEANVKQHAHFRQRLRELGLEKRLRHLRDSDVEGLVRGAAAQALVQIEVRQKKETPAP
jgi:hypothetical protein